MFYCKKYKTSGRGVSAIFHRRAPFDCSRCVYFSTKNCGTHVLDFSGQI